MSNIVYVGMSLDGYIADRNGGVEWLEIVENPDKSDYGFAEFLSSIDAIVMGRKTLETVLSFEIPWPYSKPVYIMSRSMKRVPDELNGKVEIIQGNPSEVTENLHLQGCKNLYIDGGQIIQDFLRADLIDEMILTRIPILLGGGVSLFADLPAHRVFEHVSTEVLLGQLVSSRYCRKTN